MKNKTGDFVINSKESLVSHFVMISSKRISRIYKSVGYTSSINVMQQSACLIIGPPGALGIWGECLFIFRELGSTGIYFRGAREQAHNFGDIGSLA